MNNELKYILKGILYLIIILLIAYILYFLLSHKYVYENNSQGYAFNIPKFISDSNFFNGKILFEGHCSVCHPINKTDDFLLSDLRNIIQDKKLVFGIIRNSDSVLKSGNVYYNQEFKKYNYVHMTAFSALTQSDLNNLLIYLKAEITLYKLPVQ